MRSSDIHLRAISQEIPEPSIIKLSLKIEYLKFHPNLSGHWVNLNTLRLRQNGRHFADDTFKPIFLNENIQISIKISLKFVPKVPINNIPALVQIMTWRRPGYKPLSEPMMVCLLTHICVTRPQWVNWPHSIKIYDLYQWWSVYCHIYMRHLASMS